MKINIKISSIFLFLMLGYGECADKNESQDYLKYVNEIVRDFVKFMEKKHKLHCYGSGGSMPNDVEKIDVLFTSYSKSTIDDARKMEVDAIQELLHRINTHEKIRPFLREYPFSIDRVSITISFVTKNNSWPMDGSVAFVGLAKNKIFYDAAEMKLSASFPLTRVNSHNEWTTEIIPGELQEELIPLMEETYEDALKIVESEQNKKGNNHECKQK